MTKVVKLNRHIPSATLVQLIKINDHLYGIIATLDKCAQSNRLLSRAEDMRQRLKRELDASLRIEQGQVRE